MQRMDGAGEFLCPRGLKDACVCTEFLCIAVCVVFDIKAGRSPLRELAVRADDI